MMQHRIRQSAQRFIQGGALLRRKLALSAVFAFGIAVSHAAPAHAGLLDQVKTFIQLPGQVDELKEQYDNTKQQLEDAANQLDTLARESRETIEQYRQAEERLLAENESLAQRNEQLAQAVEALLGAERERAARSRRTWTMIWTGAGLIGFYFISGRLFRFLLRSRHS